MARTGVEGIEVAPGVWARFEDYCNSTGRGAGLLYTSGMVLMEEELAVIELGARVANAQMEESVEGRGALLEAIMKEARDLA